jgi:Tat protein secretion system quality control protein TatD with DNase activity
MPKCMAAKGVEWKRPFRLYDAHNHLQDPRLAPHLEAVLAAVRRENVVKMVVNGSC